MTAITLGPSLRQLCRPQNLLFCCLAVQPPLLQPGGSASSSEAWWFSLLPAADFQQGRGLGEPYKCQFSQTSDIVHLLWSASIFPLLLKGMSQLWGNDSTPSVCAKLPKKGCLSWGRLSFPLPFPLWKRRKAGSGGERTWKCFSSIFFSFFLFASFCSASFFPFLPTFFPQ